MVPEYLNKIFSDREGKPLVINKVDLLDQAKKIIGDINTIRPINVTLADQIDGDNFPFITLNEEIDSDLSTVSRSINSNLTGPPSSYNYTHDGGTGEVGNSVSRASVNITVFSDRLYETDTMAHLIHYGLHGLKLQMEFEGMHNIMIKKISSRRIYEGLEDQNGVYADSIVLSCDLITQFPIIDQFYPDIESISIDGKMVAQNSAI